MYRFIILLLTTMALFGFLSSNDAAEFKPYPAPAVEASDQNGKATSLAEVYKKGITLVYFYPKADTPGCTAQACSLRDAYTQLTEAGVQVIGVSTDDVASQKKFADKYKLPFTLLADPDGKIVEAFGVKKIPLIGLSTRQAFLIKDNQVVWHDAKASTDQQAADVLKVLSTLK